MQDDPGIAKRKRGRQVKKAAEDAAGLTIADRLTRASRDDRIPVPMTDSGGEFTLEMREPLISERKIIQEMMTGFGGATPEQAEKDLAELLAKYSIDESLDVDFWMRAEFTPTRLQQILLTLLGLSEAKVRQAQEIIEAQSFRQD